MMWPDLNRISRINGIKVRKGKKNNCRSNINKKFLLMGPIKTRDLFPKEIHDCGRFNT